MDLEAPVPKLIALHAADFGGKDTVGEMIADIFQAPATWVPFASRAFAAKMKESIGGSFGIAFEESVDWCNRLKQDDGWVIATWTDENGGKHERKIPGRIFIRDFATVGHRELFDPDFWVDQLLPIGRPSWHSNFDHAAMCVITDLRFNSEADRVRFHGGEIWSLIGRGEPFDEDHLSNGDFEWRNADHIINNEGDLDSLRRSVEALLS